MAKLGLFGEKRLLLLLIPFLAALGFMILGLISLKNASVADAEGTGWGVVIYGDFLVAILVPVITVLLAFVMQRTALSIVTYWILALVASLPNAWFQVVTYTSSMPTMVHWIPGVPNYYGGPGPPPPFSTIMAINAAIFVAISVVVALVTYPFAMRSLKQAAIAAIAVDVVLGVCFWLGAR